MELLGLAIIAVLWFALGGSDDEVRTNVVINKKNPFDSKCYF